MAYGWDILVQPMFFFFPLAPCSCHMPAMFVFYGSHVLDAWMSYTGKMGPACLFLGCLVPGAWIA